MFGEAPSQVLLFQSSSSRMIVQVGARMNFDLFFRNLPDVLVLNSLPGSHHLVH